MNQQTVLIISDNAGDARDIVSRWQMERVVPAFTMMNSDFWEAATAAPFEVAIICGVKPAKFDLLLKRLDLLGVPVICAHLEGAAWQRVRADFPRVLPLRDGENWLDALMVLGAEVLRRTEASMRARRAEAAADSCASQAALGRYMLEARHNFNNALTAVLGNAELLMLEPSGLPGETREQLDTIHSMALRLHEMMQRFSSLETEMSFSKKQSQFEPKGRSQAYVSGS